MAAPRSGPAATSTTSAWSTSAPTLSSSCSVAWAVLTASYDAADNTIWSSGDVAGSIEQYRTNGDFLSSTPISLGNCGNSGIAVGGPLLYLANNGCSAIYTSPKDFSSAPSPFASFPARLEDVECDSVTFPLKGAIWSKDAYDNTRRMTLRDHSRRPCERHRRVPLLTPR